MGFGTLFVGYFFILNFAYASFTDAIAGILMLYGLYKLSNVNKWFTISAYLSVGFTVLGVGELVIDVMTSIAIFPSMPLINSIVAIVRVILISVLTAYMLLGMQAVSKEVGLSSLSEICKRLYVLTLPIYTINLALEVMGLFSLKEVATLLILSVISLVLNMTLTVLILIRIYDCYAKICMPEDKHPEEAPKESRFEFVNKFRRHEENKRQEYADYKLDKFKKKMKKRKNKEKK